MSSKSIPATRRLLVALIDKAANEIIEAIRSGANVPAERLAHLVRDGRPLPQDVREHIAGRLDGSIKPQGRPVAHLLGYGVKKGSFDALMREAGIRSEYYIAHPANRQLKKDDRAAYNKLCKSVKRPRASPSELTCAVLALQHDGETYDSIRNTIKRARKK